MSARARVDLRHMDRAFSLAERGRYGCSPNPMVGAVVVRGGRVVGEGYHRRAGGEHAEIAALSRAGSKARGADLYLTLEPCVHRGRTPPCAPEVIASGVARVIVAGKDPNPAVAGRGIAALRRAGIRVVLAGPAFGARERALNERFQTWITLGRPFVLAKWAATLDGATASASGESQWITGEPARRRALLLREEYDAVLVGAGTVLADDPRLTRRLARNRVTQQWRIVLDGRLRVPETARVLRGTGERLVVTAMALSHPRARRLLGRGRACLEPSGTLARNRRSSAAAEATRRPRRLGPDGRGRRGDSLELLSRGSRRSCSGLRGSADPRRPAARRAASEGGDSISATRRV